VDQLQIRRECRRLGERANWGAGGVYALQAAIIACHAEARTAAIPTGRASPDFMRSWRRRALADHRPQPCGCRRHGRGPGSGAGERGPLVREPALKGYHLLPSVRGDLLHKLGRHEEARAAFEAAAALAGNRREHDLLRRAPPRRPTPRCQLVVAADSLATG